MNPSVLTAISALKELWDRQFFSLGKITSLGKEKLNSNQFSIIIDFLRCILLMPEGVCKCILVNSIIGSYAILVALGQI